MRGARLASAGSPSFCPLAAADGPSCWVQVGHHRPHHLHGSALPVPHHPLPDAINGQDDGAKDGTHFLSECALLLARDVLSVLRTESTFCRSSGHVIRGGPEGVRVVEAPSHSCFAAHMQAIRPELEKLSAKLKENVSSSSPTLL
jgi:hypothetical protein